MSTISSRPGVAFTLGYATAATLTEKFTKHGRDLGFATEQEYLDTADTFLGGPLDATTTWECRRLLSTGSQTTLNTFESSAENDDV
jgi:hypothetical protein